jgi:hypothetical protein
MVHANEARLERPKSPLECFEAGPSAGTLRGETVAVAACRSVLPEPTLVCRQKFPKSETSGPPAEGPRRLPNATLGQNDEAAESNEPDETHAADREENRHKL